MQIRHFRIETGLCVSSHVARKGRKLSVSLSFIFLPHIIGLRYFVGRLPCILVRHDIFVYLVIFFSLAVSLSIFRRIFSIFADGVFDAFRRGIVEVAEAISIIRRE